MSLGQFLSVAGWVAYARAQSQETINALASQRLSTIESRVIVLEGQDVAARLRILEADMAEVKWLGRSVAALVASQLVTMLLGLRESRKRP